MKKILFFTIGLLLILVGTTVLKIISEPTAPKKLRKQTEGIPQVGLPVFPGAEGFGTLTPAGRGGKVIEVTSLADSGPGTLREALNYPSPRIIVFGVGGIIELKSHLFINHPFVTIAGQTAPGDGIVLKDFGLAITTNDVLIQHIRIRPGNEGHVRPDDNDAIAIFGKHSNVSGAHDVVLDHISASWSEDEVISTWFAPHDITLSWSIISEALDRSRHPKKTHSAGLLIADNTEHVSIHHNLLAHNDFRNPLIISGGTHDFVNNVIYNWGQIATEIVDFDSDTFLNFVGNVYIPGPSIKTPHFKEIIINIDRGSKATPKIYVKNNLGPHRQTQDIDDWEITGFQWDDKVSAPKIYRLLTPFATPPITKLSATEVLGKVLAEAGATAPKRDAVDLRVVADVKKKSGSIINSPKEVGGYPRFERGTPPTDRDHDGMPDEWENKMGLDPNDPFDANGDLDRDGYTNIEEYLHSLLK